MTQSRGSSWRTHIHAGALLILLVVFLGCASTPAPVLRTEDRLLVSVLLIDIEKSIEGSVIIVPGMENRERFTVTYTKDDPMGRICTRRRCRQIPIKEVRRLIAELPEYREQAAVERAVSNHGTFWNVVVRVNNDVSSATFQGTPPLLIGEVLRLVGGGS